MEAKLLITMLISTLSRRPVASGRPGGLVIKELDRSFQIPHLAELWGVKKALKTRSCSRGPAKFSPQIQEEPPLAFAVTGFGSFFGGDAGSNPLRHSKVYTTASVSSVNQWGV